MSGQEVFMHISIDNILPNPWQPRETEDLEHIQALAASIKQDGLLQNPVGRKVGEKIELAFGQSRLAAYKWLRDGHLLIDDEWAEMPVMVREISDEEMFRLAVSENVQRRDLTPIEAARAMKRYRDEFGKTSKEIGELFGMSESTVRNKMRLVELPENAQKALEDGAITENGARRLLSIQKILPAEKVAELAESIATGDYSKPEQVDSTLQYAVSQAKSAQRLHYAWSNRLEKHANDMWPLDWDSREAISPEITFAQFKKMYSGPETVTIDYPNIQAGIPDSKNSFELKEIFYYAYLFVIDEQEKRASSTVTRRIAEAAPEALEAIRHLAKPPACSKCPFYLVLAGEGFCGRRVCFERKKQVWLAEELERVSKEMDIPIYDPAVDGKFFIEYRSWGALGEWFSKALKDKAVHLRVRNSKSLYTDNITKSNVVEVISVEAKRVNQLRAEYEAREKSELTHASQDAKRLQRIGEADAYLENSIAGVVFGAYMFGHLGQGALRFLARCQRIRFGDHEPERSELLAALGKDLLSYAVDWDTRTLGMEAVKKHLIGLAKEIGMPAERLSVSVETAAAHE